jgi:hypothetical protein
MALDKVFTQGDGNKADANFVFEAFLNTLLLPFLDESALGKECVDLASDKLEHAYRGWRRGLRPAARFGDGAFEVVHFHREHDAILRGE